MTNYPNNLDTTITLPIATDLNLPLSTNSVKGIIKLTNDLGGTADLPTVVGIQNNPINDSTPTNNQVLTWVDIDGYWAPRTLNPGGVADADSITKGVLKLTQDLGGTADLPNVVGLQGYAISTNAPEDGYALVWNSGTSEWEPAPVTASIVDADSITKGAVKLTQDLGGTADLPNVVGLQGRSVSATAPTNGQALAWNNTGSVWEPTTITTSVPDADGSTKGILQLTNDLGGTASSPTVTGLQGRDVSSTAPTNGQALVWNNSLSTWEPTTVTTSVPDADGSTKGILQLTNDLGGTATSPIVTGLQGYDINGTAPNNAEALVWDGVNNYWKPTSVTSLIPDAQSNIKGLIELDTDLGGTASSPNVVGLQGYAVGNIAPLDEQALVWNNFNAQWEPKTIIFDASTSVKGIVQLTNDLGGTATSPTVTGLQGRDISSTAPTNGQVLVWNNSLSIWEPATITTSVPDADGSTKGILQLTNDLGGTAASPIVTGLQGYDVANTAPSSNYILAWNTSNNRWQPTDMSSIQYLEPFQQISEMINDSGISANGGLPFTNQSFTLTAGSKYLAAGFSKPIIGLKFYWGAPAGGPFTIRGRLYVTSTSSAVAEGTVSVNAQGIYTITFSTPYTLTGTDLRNYIYAAIYNLTDSTKYTSIVTTNLGDHPTNGNLNAPNIGFLYAPGLCYVCPVYETTEIKPTINTTTEIYPIDLIYSV